MRNLSKTAALLVVAVVAAYGCADRVNPTGPELRPDGAGPSYTTLSSDTLVNVLKRTTALSQDLVASAVIGSGGGTIEIRDAGIKVLFPRGAVASDTRITVTAHAGDLVAYSFEPHGTVFAKTVSVEQALQGTEASNRTDFSSSRRGYFKATTDINWLTKTAIVSEPAPVELLLSKTGNKVKFNLDHFSGYLLGVGLDDGI